MSTTDQNADQQWKVEVWGRQPNERHAFMAGQMLFDARDEAQRYADNLEDSAKDDESSTWCLVLRAQPGDKEWA
jgi:hypothetical protein